MQPCPPAAEPHDDLMLEGLPYDLDEGLGRRAVLGLLALASDQTIEHEFRRLIRGEGVALHVARVPNLPDSVTLDTLRTMEPHIAGQAALLLPGRHVDVVAFGCTSGTLAIGETRVSELVQSVQPGAAVTTPITAARVAFTALNLRRVAVLTPYCRPINLLMRDHLEAHGFRVPVLGTFSEEDDNKACRIRPASIARAVARLVREGPPVDGVFISCTSLRAAALVSGLEAALGVAVTTSNHALAWHVMRLAGIKDGFRRGGRLFSRGLLPVGGSTF